MKRLLALLLLLAPLANAADRAFSARFSQNVPGDILLIGNTLETCSNNPALSANAANAAAIQNGTITDANSLNNNNFMEYVNAAGVLTTPANSSFATLNLPPGAVVLFAGLYWGADTAAGLAVANPMVAAGVAAPNAAAKNIATFSTPAASNQTLTADQTDTSTGEPARYQCFKDVTALVRAGGSGSYQVANVQAGTGAERYAGWTLAVAFRTPGAVPRNLTVFDGLQRLNNSTITVPISGFITPNTGPVNVKLGVMAWEGDFALTGDQFRFNGVNVGDAVNPTTNFFNSTVSQFGAHYTAKTPNYVNQLAFDADLTQLPVNSIGNNVTTANVSFTSTGDVFLPGLLTTAIDLYAPVVNATKTLTNTSGGAVNAGDILEFTIVINNTAGDNAGNIILTDPIPANMTYDPGSLEISDGANAGAKSDSAGNDQAEFDSANNRVVFRLGTGANGTNGGTLPIGGTTTIKFRAQVIPTTPTGTTLTNQAAVSYNSVANPTITLATASSAVSAENTRSLEGRIFEDVNYGGGAGRGFSASGGVRIPGARVELYDSTGAFVNSSITDAVGVYSFVNPPPGNYTVRVVSNTVASARPGAIAGLLPVPTFVPGDVNRVGGEDPSRNDAGAGSSTLAALDVPGSTVAQARAAVIVGSGSTMNQDFGFNFSTVTSIRSAGQGTLRQFLINANALGNAGLAQAGRPPGIESAIFMIGNGSSAAGLRPALNFFSGGMATIAPNAVLPAITDPVVLDGRAQPGFATTPVIQLSGANVSGNGLAISAGASSVRGLAIGGWSGSGVLLSAAGGNTIAGNFIGTNPAGTAADANGVGVTVSSSSGNFLGTATTGDGNVISGNSSHGVALTGTSSGNTLRGNFIGLEATGATPLANGGSGVSLAASGNTVGGILAGEANRIGGNGGGGVAVASGGNANAIRRNVFFGNTGLGIDLGTTGVTPNDGALGGANNGLDYPVFTSATLTGGNLAVAGYVGNVPGRSTFGGVTVDVFIADNVPADQSGAVLLGDGRSLPHGEGRTYLGTLTADANGYFRGNIPAGALAASDTVTASAIDAAGNTSEFSANAPVNGVLLSGAVYEDANRNVRKDSAETGAGIALFVKLIDLALPAGSPALAVAAVDPATGAYGIFGVAPGSYALVLDDNATLTDVTPTLPAGFMNLEISSGRRTPVNVALVPISDLNFGISPGRPLTGRVFADTGAGGGTANNGALDGGEIGIPGATVRLTNASGSTTYSTATTDGSGAFALAFPSTLAPGTPLRIIETNPAGYLSTGATLGNLGSGAAYNRTTDVITFNVAAGTNYSGVAFADVPVNTLLTDGAQTALPNSVVFYPHTFTAGTAGQVTFSTVSVPTPAIPGWTAVLYLDANGNGAFDDAEPQITGPIAVTSGQVVRLLVKEFVPLNAPMGARDQVTLRANFTYANAPSITVAALTRRDVTTVGEPTGSAGLLLSKSVDKTSALPGEELTYTITYTNQGAEPLSTISIFDTTPAFSTFISASNGPPPAGLIGPTLTAPAPNGTGAIKWAFTGTLAPAATGTVSFTIQIDQ